MRVSEKGKEKVVDNDGQEQFQEFDHYDIKLVYNYIYSK